MFATALPTRGRRCSQTIAGNQQHQHHEHQEKAILAYLSRWLPSLRQPIRGSSRHANLIVATIADELTRSCLEHECQVIDLTPSNFESVLRKRRPDLLFVESAWSGHRDAWKYRIAAYPDHRERTNADLRRLVHRARDLGIATVFWNKEDCVHFDRFIESASLFDVVLTIDSSCIERYRAVNANLACVAALPFAVQPSIHGFSGIDDRRTGANFVGSYSHHLHDERRRRQDMLLLSAAQRLGLTVYDRNSERRARDYRYPPFPGLRVRPKVSHHRTADVYKSHLASLNVNTVEDSDTMFSRRLVEILACGGLAVTTPARSIDRWFKDYCHVVESPEEANSLFDRLARDGYSPRDREMMRAGSDYVLAQHTWSQRIDTILGSVGRAPESVAA